LIDMPQGANFTPLPAAIDQCIEGGRSPNQQAGTSGSLLALDKPNML
jgi:hypothetical protein